MDSFSCISYFLGAQEGKHFQQEKGHMQLHRNLEHPSVFGEGKQNVIPRAERIKGAGVGWSWKGLQGLDQRGLMMALDYGGFVSKASARMEA